MESFNVYAIVWPSMEKTLFLIHLLQAVNTPKIIVCHQVPP